MAGTFSSRTAAFERCSDRRHVRLPHRTLERFDVAGSRGEPVGGRQGAARCNPCWSGLMPEPAEDVGFQSVRLDGKHGIAGVERAAPCEVGPRFRGPSHLGERLRRLERRTCAFARSAEALAEHRPALEGERPLADFRRELGHRPLKLERRVVIGIQFVGDRCQVSQAFGPEESAPRRAGEPQRQVVGRAAAVVTMRQRSAEELDVVGSLGLEPGGEPAVQAPLLRHIQLTFDGLPDEVVGEPHRRTGLDDDAAARQPGGRLGHPRRTPRQYGAQVLG